MGNVSFFSTLWNIVAEAAPFLLLGFVAAGLFRALIPERQVFRLLGQDGFRPVLLASLIGVPLPLCSCSVIPAATALRQSGASRGATTSFLISAPETGVDSISITWALMDPIMTVTRPVAAFATALLTGAAINRLADPDAGRAAAGGAPADPARQLGPASSTMADGPAARGTPPNAPVLPANGPADDCCSPCCAEPEPTTAADAATTAAIAAPDDPRASPGTDDRRSGGAVRDRRAAAADGIRYAFGPLLDDLAPWLALGFALAAIIAVLVPDGLLTAVPAGWISATLMMLVATPVYVCAAAATPIAAALILKGLDPGAALVLLLVGPATNVTTMLVVLRFMGKKVLAVYLAGVTASALAFGFAINALYAGLGIDLAALITLTEAGGTSVLQTIAAIVLLALLAASLWRRLSARRTAREAAVTPMIR
ncbi:MAG TPA: SO_0444 family Cu/Zn efflux transporter [Acidobacteriota bacterium]